MAVNAEAMYLVASLVPLHFGLLEACPAGVWQLHGMPGCVEEAQAVDSVLPFPSQMTSVGWRLSRLPLLPKERQEDKAVRGRRWVRDGTAGLSQLSFTEEVENISVPHGLWGGWSRAEQANTC